MSALIGVKSLYKSFIEWVLAFGVIGTASGTLIGNAVTDLAKSIATDIVVPASLAIMGQTNVPVNFPKLLTAVSQFAIMIILAYTFAIFVGVQKARPVTLVKVIK